MFKQLATLATAAAMAVAPALAHANPASALSVASAQGARAGAEVDGEGNIVWSAGTIVIAIIVVGLVIYGITELTDDDGPKSA